MLAEALELKARTSLRLWRRKRLLTKKKKPDGIVDKADVFLFKPEERKYNAILSLNGPGNRRAFIDVLPGKSKKHDHSHAKRLRAAIEMFHKPWIGVALFSRDKEIIKHSTVRLFPRWQAWFYMCALLRNISERSAIHDLADDQDQWVQICMLPYKASIRGDVYTPFPDFELSNFHNLDIYYRVTSDFLYAEMFKKPSIQRTIESIWKCRVLIEDVPGMPGVVRIYPVGRIDIQAAIPELPIKEALPALAATPAVPALPSPAGAPAPALPPSSGVPLVTLAPNTMLRFGYSVRGDVGTPIEFDLLDILNETHFMGLGGSGSGKTNAIGGTLYQLGEIIKQGQILSRGYFLDIAKRAAGLHMYKENFRFAIDEKEIRETLHDIAANHAYRVKVLEQLQMTNWPVGQVIDGKRYTGMVIVVDELQALLMEKWLVNDMKIPDLFTYWSRQLRSYGMLMMLYTQKARANEGVPTGLTDNIFMRQCLRIKDRKLAADFFNCDGTDFSRHPVDLDRGEFVLEAPWIRRDYFYGKTELAPHEVLLKRAREAAPIHIGRGTVNDPATRAAHN